MKDTYHGVSIETIKEYALVNMNLPEEMQVTVGAKNGMALSNPWIDESARFPLSDREAVETWGEGTVDEFCELASERVIEKEEFERECYNAYQLDWMVRHGWSLADLYEIFVEYAAASIEDDAMNIPTDSHGVESLAEEARNYFLYESGFCGSLFVCKEEFLTHEFRDPKYMAHLFAAMYKGEERQRYYYMAHLFDAMYKVEERQLL